MNLIATTVPVADVDWGHMGDWGAGSWLAMIAFWALIIILVVWVLREFAAPPRRGVDPPSAIEILDRRFAAGEISSEEYREHRAVLRGEATASTDRR